MRRQQQCFSAAQIGSVLDPWELKIWTKLFLMSFMGFYELFLMLVTFSLRLVM